MPRSYPKSARGSTRAAAEDDPFSDAPPRKPIKPKPVPNQTNDPALSLRFHAWLDDKDTEGEELDRMLNDRLGLRRCWIDMTGDHAAAIMLAQIIYWYFIPSKETGKSKLTIRKHERSWLAKSDREWWEECRLTRSQVDRILQQFRDAGWIVTRVMRFNGSPTTHISVNRALLHSWKDAVDNPAPFVGK